MKERTKGYLAGVVTVILAVSMVSGAKATIAKRTLEIDYNDISVELNGEKIALTDVNGYPVEPFAHGGTTYLPVRAVGNALGLDVSWDADKNLVILNSKAGVGSNYIEFTVPSYSNIVGEAALLKTGQLVSMNAAIYEYDCAKYTVSSIEKAHADYGKLLEEYGFTFEGYVEQPRGQVAHYVNTFSKIEILIGPLSMEGGSGESVWVGAMGANATDSPSALRGTYGSTGAPRLDFVVGLNAYVDDAATDTNTMCYFYNLDFSDFNSLAEILKIYKPILEEAGYKNTYNSKYSNGDSYATYLNSKMGYEILISELRLEGANSCFVSVSIENISGNKNTASSGSGSHGTGGQTSSGQNTVTPPVTTDDNDDAYQEAYRKAYTEKRLAEKAASEKYGPNEDSWPESIKLQIETNYKNALSGFEQ